MVGAGAMGAMVWGAGAFGTPVLALFWVGLFGLLAWVVVGLLTVRQRREAVAGRTTTQPEQRLYERRYRGEIDATEHSRALERLVSDHGK